MPALKIQEKRDSGRCFSAFRPFKKNTRDRSSTISQCLECRWQLCPLVPSLLVSLFCVFVSVPTLACWRPCSPHPQLSGRVHGLSPHPVSHECLRPPWATPEGPLCIFLSCFTFHFRIPCRADPSPECPSPPRAYRSVARISYISQATWGRKRMTQGRTPGKLGGPSSPALQSSGGAAASGTGQSA